MPQLCSELQIHIINNIDNNITNIITRYISDKQTHMNGGHNTAEAGQDTFLHQVIREVIKKNCEKTVRLTAWVDPPSPEAVRKM